MDTLPIGTEIDPLGQLIMGGFAEDRDTTEFRSSRVSNVERHIVKQPNICLQCRNNNDPRKVPLHPHCDCNVVTDGIDVGVADPESRLLGILDPGSIEMQLISGALESAGIQLDPGSIAIMDLDNVRFSDFARWLETVQPYLDAGSQYVSIITDDDTDEALQNVEESVSLIADDSSNIAEAIRSKKLWFSIAKAVAF